MDKKLVRAFVQECIDVQDWEARYEANHIEMNEWFKHSGEVEEEKPLHEFKSYKSNKFLYKENKRCDTLNEIRIKKYKNENNRDS